MEKLVIFSHHKCATTWLRKFVSIYAVRYGVRTLITGHTLNPSGADEADLLVFENSTYKFVPRHRHRKALHIIRNPLDIIVSAYYSHRNVHPTDNWPELAEQRKRLLEVDKEHGLMLTWLFLERAFTFQKGVAGTLYALRNWRYHKPPRVLRSEDIAYDTLTMQKILDEFFERDTRDITRECVFEKMSGGRKLGEIDETQHLRCGLDGQWKTEMSPQMAKSVYMYYRELIERFYGYIGLHFDEMEH